MFYHLTNKIAHKLSGLTSNILITKKGHNKLNYTTHKTYKLPFIYLLSCEYEWSKIVKYRGKFLQYFADSRGKI